VPCFSFTPFDLVTADWHLRQAGNTTFNIERAISGQKVSPLAMSMMSALYSIQWKYSSALY